MTVLYVRLVLEHDVVSNRSVGLVHVIFVVLPVRRYGIT